MIEEASTLHVEAHATHWTSKAAHKHGGGGGAGCAAFVCSCVCLLCRGRVAAARWLTSKHFVFVLLEVFDGGLCVVNQGTGRLCAHAALHAATFRHTRLLEQPGHQGCIHHQSQHHEPARPQRHLQALRGPSELVCRYPDTLPIGLGGPESTRSLVRIALHLAGLSFNLTRLGDRIHHEIFESA